MSAVCKIWEDLTWHFTKLNWAVLLIQNINLYWYFYKSIIKKFTNLSRIEKHGPIFQNQKGEVFLGLENWYYIHRNIWMAIGNSGYQSTNLFDGMSNLQTWKRNCYIHKNRWTQSVQKHKVVWHIITYVISKIINTLLI